MDGSHLEAGDGLGNGDKLARVVGEHLSDLEGSVEIRQINLVDKYLEGLRQEPLDLPRPSDLDLVLQR